MQPKIVGIISSPARNGNTAVLVREALRAAVECGAEVEEIFLPALKLQYCTGCYHCMSEGGCPLPDGFEEIRRKLYACDGIVIGSPTYVQKPNAMMKNLFDRLGLFTPYTSSLAGKYVVGISTAEGFGATKVAKELTGIVSGMFGYGCVTGTLGVLRGEGRIEQKPEKLQRARELGRRLVDDIERRRRYPFQALLPRLLTALIARRFILRSVLDNREDRMKTVYENLVARGPDRTEQRVRHSARTARIQLASARWCGAMWTRCGLHCRQNRAHFYYKCTRLDRATNSDEDCLASGLLCQCLESVGKRERRIQISCPQVPKSCVW